LPEKDGDPAVNILITQRHSINAHGDWIDSLENSYVRYFETLGLVLFPVPSVTGNLERFIESVSPGGIILSGGGNVAPDLYGGQACDMGAVSKERDRCEWKLLEIAVRKDIPVLGICRGMQFINVFFGGKLLGAIKDIDTQCGHGVASRHNIRILDDGFLRKIGNHEFQVNSYHNQGILPDGLGKDLEAFAVYEGLGLIEAFRHMLYPIAGIQWHPERAGSSEKLDRTLIQGFLDRTLFWRARK
jgi:putative glutamine amidotransferase